MNRKNISEILKKAVLFLSLFVLFLILFTACNNQANQSSKSNPVKIIFDTDMGSDCDDVGALAILHQYQRAGKAEILACIYSSGKIPYGAGVIDAINTYFQKPDIPVGACHKNEVGDPVDKMNAKKLAENTGLYKHDIIQSQDAVEQSRVNRRVLALQEDNSVVYLTVGHTKGLYDLLVSEPDDISSLSGKELVEKKIKHWVALGALNANNPENQYSKDWNFYFNNTAPYTDYLIEHFPRPVYFINAGSDVYTGSSLKELPDGNILTDAYSSWLWNYEKKSLEDQRPSWDLAAVYFAVEAEGDFLEEELTGRLDFNAGKGSLWIQGKNDFQHHYINQKEGVSSEFADYLNRLMIK